MIFLKKKYYLQILFILSLITLISAYSIQYLLGYKPCNLCLIERIPYMLAIIILFLNYRFKRDEIFFSILLILIFLFSFLISMYHYGIEIGLIEESSICASNSIDLISKDEILKSLQKINISCKDVTFRIFGFSLTMYNILLSIIMFLISMKVYFISNDNKE